MSDVKNPFIFSLKTMLAALLIERTKLCGVSCHVCKTTTGEFKMNVGDDDNSHQSGILKYIQTICNISEDEFDRLLADILPSQLTNFEQHEIVGFLRKYKK